jgi:hypothetical protein
MKCSDMQMFFDQMHREGDDFENMVVLDHMKACKACTREYLQWSRIARKLEGSPALDAPPALYDRVMREVVNNAAPVSIPVSRPQWRRLRIPLALAALLLITIGTSVLLRKQSVGTIDPQIISQPEMPQQHTNENIITAHFECAHTAAQKISLVGDFNGWNKDMHQLQRKADGTWSIDIRIPKGCYQYLFYIDENVWLTDPHGSEKVPDGFGGYNTVIEL